MAVRWIGAQRDVLAGDVAGTIELASLAGEEHLYALGPCDRLRGEVTILDGRAFISRVIDGAIEVDARFEGRACFLVYAALSDWVERPVGPVSGNVEVEALVAAEAAEVGLDLQEPFPFRLTGTPDRLTLHVLDKRDTRPHTPALHEEAKVRFEYAGEPAEIIGFFSRSHRGIFTPREANVHMHATSRAGRVAGHVDDVVLAAGATLWLPRMRGGKDDSA